jgi:AcrR family transcriptional regulator
MKETVKRGYSSPHREQQARATRRAVIEAASRLFAAGGYVATSIDEIAAEAGVSRATVFSVGGKPDLLKLAQDVAIVGDDEPMPLVERPRSRQNLAEPDPARFLEGYAELCTEMGGRVAGIHEAIRAAAHADDEIRDLWERITSERRGGARRVASEVKKRRALRRDLTLSEAGHVVAIYNDPSLYHQLVLEQGWAPTRFLAWLSETMKVQLLDPTSTSPEGLASPR